MTKLLLAAMAVLATLGLHGWMGPDHVPIEALQAPVHLQDAEELISDVELVGESLGQRSSGGRLQGAAPEECEGSGAFWHGLMVIVVDEQGRRREGYPVNLCFRDSDGKYRRAGPDSTHSALADRYGEARFAVGSNMAEVGLCVASGLMWQVESYTYLARELRGQVVTLHVPCTASIRVRVVDSEGRPWAQDCLVHAESVEGFHKRLRAERGEDGDYWIHGAPFGDSYRVGAEDTASGVIGRGECGLLEEGGPPGLVRLELGKRQARLAGRLRWSDGSLAKSVTGSRQVQAGPKLELKTDAHGRFEFTHLERVKRRCVFRFSRDHSEDEELHLELFPISGGRTISVGTVDLQKRPILVSGSLIFPTKPKSTIHAGKETSAVLPRMSISIEGLSPLGSWRYLETIRSTDNGEFRSYSRYDHKQLRLRVTPRRRFANWVGQMDPTPFENGTADLQLKLKPLRSLGKAHASKNGR